jgi:hypothetical protein
MGSLAVNVIMEGVNANLEKREVSIARHRTNPELVIRESTRAAALTGADEIRRVGHTERTPKMGHV